MEVVRTPGLKTDGVDAMEAQPSLTEMYFRFMRIVIQRVSEARVTIGDTETGRIGSGMLVLLGIEDDDDTSDVDWLVQKVCALRIFPDDEDKMNRDIQEAGGAILVVSQFTLHAHTKKGNRPSFIRAARPEKAIPLYQAFLTGIEKTMGHPPEKGEFGAMMQVHLVNDGPVTILIDSKQRE